MQFKCLGVLPGGLPWHPAPDSAGYGQRPWADAASERAFNDARGHRVGRYRPI